MLQKIIILIFVTLLPFIELRLSIPLGILKGKVNLPYGITLQGFGMHWLLVFLICVITNAILGIVIYFMLDKVIHLFLKIRPINRCYQKVVERTQRKIQPYVEKWGWIGLALFIGLPIPGSGSYSGALGGYLLGMGYKKFAWANLIGVIIAGILVTVITLAGQGIITWL
ncbi:small multi-drug export protein [Candidatus Woesearchaeota archaeon]|nr:small multi-drug export protein [Candidatus Woesearchaeota archaeon]